MLNYIYDNYTWIFSGVGVSILMFLYYILKKIFFNNESQINRVTMKNINANGDVIGRDKR